MKTLSRHVVLVTALAVTACAPPPAEQPDTRAEDEVAIRDAVEQWSASAQAKDADAFVSFYTDDGRLMVEDAPDMQGRDALHEGIAGMMQDPNFDLSFGPDEVVVARAGDIAYETGTYTLTMTGEDGEAATEQGHYLVVWEKQAGGEWKVVVDVPVSDPPGE